MFVATMQGDAGRPGIPGTDGASGVHVRCLVYCMCVHVPYVYVRSLTRQVLL